MLSTLRFVRHTICNCWLDAFLDRQSPTQVVTRRVMNATQEGETLQNCPTNLQAERPTDCSTGSQANRWRSAWFPHNCSRSRTVPKSSTPPRRVINSGDFIAIESFASITSFDHKCAMFVRWASEYSPDSRARKSRPLAITPHLCLSSLAG
jgi:hypothetical protein